MGSSSHAVAARNLARTRRSAYPDRSSLLREMGAGGEGDAGRRSLRLASIVEAEIIPRLMLAHASPGVSATEAVRALEVAPAEVAEFSRLILAGDTAGTLTWIDSLRSRGTSLETVFLQLLAPAARHLGELWVADLCDFTDVTVGLWRLQHLLHDLAPDFRKASESPLEGRRILLMPAPGEQHTFGLFMVAEFFRRAGWTVWGELPRTTEGMLDTVRRERLDVAGFSVGHECQIERLTAIIGAVRGASCNPSIHIVVGGPAFMQNPGLVSRIGADAMAIDGRDAVHKVERLMSRQRKP